MKFNRDVLETLQAALTEALNSTQAILSVLPSGCETTIEIDYFRKEPLSVLHTNALDRFPVCAIDADAIELSEALDDIEAVIVELFPEDQDADAWGVNGPTFH